MNVTIIIPTHNPDKELLNEIERAISKQEFDGKVKVIKVSGMGLADSLNYGIKKAKTSIVVSLHQDCVPSRNDWLANLVEPFKDKNIVASVSKVELPLDFWKKFSLFARIFSVKEQKIITPLMDEKGCAYRKSALEQAGLFDGKTFRTAGEDFDMYLKLKKIGKIVYPDAKVVHYHKHTFRNRMKKELQLSEGFGTLVRKYKTNMPDWYRGIIKSIPIIGWPFFLINFPYTRMFFGGIAWVFLSLLVNLVYSYGFWKGFLTGRQRV